MDSTTRIRYMILTLYLLQYARQFEIKYTLTGFMMEVSALPRLDNPQRAHSSLAGPLANFQGRLSEQFLRIIGRMNSKARSVSEKCNSDLSNLFESFRQKENELIEKQNEIIESIAAATESFDTLHERLNSYGDQLIQEVQKLREDAKQIYSDSFQTIKPFIEEAAESSKEIIKQIPPYVAERLQQAVNHLNSSYLVMKRKLIETLYAVEVQAREQISASVEKFETKRSDWNSNRFQLLVTRAKEQLNPTTDIDFGTLYEDFHRDQANFTKCARKLLSDVTLIAPPGRFTEADLDQWWKDVEEIVGSHENFVKQFTAKFQAVLTDRMTKNTELMSELEEELSSLKDETEAAAAMAELTPMYSQSQKIQTIFMEKLTKYWTHRGECLRKSYEGIRTFLSGAIAVYQEYVGKIKEVQEKEVQGKEEYTKASTELLEDLEKQLSEKKDEIYLLASDSEIDAAVTACKQILGKIETEYRDYFAKMQTLLTGQQELITNIFVVSEVQAADVMKLRKTNDMTGYATLEKSPMKRGSGRNSRQSSFVSKSRQGSPLQRRKAMKAKGGKGQAAEQQIFNFTLECGAKFEEVEKIEVIPTFDDFVDEPPPPVPTKGHRGRGGAHRARARGRGGVGSRSSRGKGRVDDDDSEPPYFRLADVVPKISGEVSIWVYVPLREETTDWVASFRQQLISSVYDQFQLAMSKARNEDALIEIQDQFNERMRMHGPRASDIAVNVAEARKRKLENSKFQTETYFKRFCIDFNKSAANMEAAIARKKATLADKCDSLRRFIDELANQKSTILFKPLAQNLHIAEKQCLTNIAKGMDDLQAEADKFSALYKARNERFKQVTLGESKDDGDKEREIIQEYCERMEKQMADLDVELRNEIEKTKQELDTRVAGVVSEYESVSQHHHADVAFIEAIAQSVQESKSKYEALLARNKHQANEIERCADLLRTAIDKDDEPSAKIKLLITSLEKLRSVVVQRAISLKMLKSSLDPTEGEYNVEIDGKQHLNDPDENQVNVRKGPVRSRVRTSGNKQDLMKKAAPNTKQAGKPPKPGTQGRKSRNTPVLEVPKTTDLNTIEGQLEQLRVSLINSAAQLAADYYASVKTRKFEITRPDMIPPTQQEVVEKVTKEWNSSVNNFDTIMEQSHAKFRCQLLMVFDVARDCVKTIFALYSQFFMTHLTQSRDEVQKRFDEQFAELNKEKHTHEQKLSPNIASENALEEFQELTTAEKERAGKEREVVSVLKSMMFNCERRIMMSYTSQMNTVVGNLLKLFDGFTLSEDLIEGPEVNRPRKTMREMLKDRERNIRTPVTGAGRPFHMRDWPTLSMIMKPLFRGPPEEVTQALADQPVDAAKGRSGGRRTARTRMGDRTTSATVSQAFDTDDQMHVLNSFETPIHRSVIMERNRSYQAYESALAKRMSELEAFVNSVNTENEAFAQHWLACIQSLKPSYTEPEPIPEPAPPAPLLTSSRRQGSRK